MKDTVMRLNLVFLLKLIGGYGKNDTSKLHVCLVFMEPDYYN